MKHSWTWAHKGYIFVFYVHSMTCFYTDKKYITIFRLMRSNGRSRKQIPDLSLRPLTSDTCWWTLCSREAGKSSLTLVSPSQPTCDEISVCFTLSEMISLYIMDSASFFVLYLFSRPFSTMLCAKQKRLLINEY